MKNRLQPTPLVRPMGRSSRPGPALPQPVYTSPSILKRPDDYISSLMSVARLVCFVVRHLVDQGSNPSGVHHIYFSNFF